MRTINPEIRLTIIKSLVFASAAAVAGLLMEYFEVPFHLLLSIIIMIVLVLALTRPAKQMIGHYIIDALLSIATMTVIQIAITLVAGVFELDILSSPFVVLCILVGLILVFAKLSSITRVCAFFDKYYLPNRSVVLFSIISTLLMIAVIVNLLYHHDELLDVTGRGQIYLVSIGYFVVCIFLTISLYRERKANQAKTALLKYSEDLQKAVDDYRMSVHDFKSHVQTIIYLNREKDGTPINKDLDAYVEEMIGKRNRASDKSIILDDALVSAMLHQKRDLAQESGIDFSVNHIGKLLAYRIPQVDLIEVLDNLIGNAFEAVAAMEPDARAVWLDFKEDSIEIKNPALFDDDAYGDANVRRFSEKGYSTKGVGRGYGLSNVLDTAARHGIKVNSSFAGGMVVFKLEFPQDPQVAG